VPLLASKVQVLSAETPSVHAKEGLLKRAATSKWKTIAGEI